jgi:hypothetical protein
MLSIKSSSTIVQATASKADRFMLSLAYTMEIPQ